MSQDTENTIKGCLFILLLLFIGWVWLTDSGSDSNSSTRLQPTKSLPPTTTPWPTDTPKPNPTRRPTIPKRHDTRKNSPTKTPETRISAVVTARGLNVRTGPGVQYSRVGAIGKGTRVLLDGQNQQGTWVHGQIPEEDLEGWVSMGYIEVDGNIIDLPVLEAHIASLSQPTARPRPRPTYTRSIQTTGIGVSRNEVQSLFEGLGVEFEELEPIGGEPHVQGWSQDSRLMIQLIGPPDNLVSASIMTAVYSAEPDAVVESAGYMVLFLDKVVPGWEGGLDWIGSNLQKSAEQVEGVKMDYENVEIILQSIMASDGGIITLTVSSIQ